MDLERLALTLMLQLLSSDSPHAHTATNANTNAAPPSTRPNGGDSRDLEKTRSKVGVILETFRKEGNVKDFVLEEVSVRGHLDFRLTLVWLL